MANRVSIATYVVDRRNRRFEGASPLEAVGEVPVSEPTPQQVAELSRALQLIEQAQGRPGVMATVRDELGSNLQTFLTEIAEKHGRLDVGPNATLEVQFDSDDILGWAGSFFTWWRKLTPFDWKTPDPPETMPAKFRVAVFGDWGTGLYGAPVCARSIEKDGKYDVVLHLGDVYYSGTEKEMTERFLELWPRVPGARNRALNGNHEMYTGGRAYAKAFTGFAQTASYFALQNDHWILACLDTAYEDHDLKGEQVAWLEGLAADAPDKRLLLFSHHQPFSLLDSQGPKLIARLSSLFSAKRIFGWYWGHEHHCIIYDAHPLWNVRGRCVGHGGFPYFREKKVLGDRAPATPTWRSLEGKNLVPGAQILDGRNDHIADAPQDYGPNGYMTLEFDGPDLFEIVHDPHGHKLWERSIDD